ncbi:NTP transferase domain-containing protein [Caulobacter sp.]|uniref:NTP transferase domain-containing protein n=1 Tax=Caulobacter sp. TaxID=78 RepID=UPI001620118E
MSSQPESFVGVILAGQRPGRVDALAEAAGVVNKNLVPIQGAPLVRHVVDALAATPGLSRLRIVVEPGTAPLIDAVLPHSRLQIDYVPAANNLADSVYAAVEGVGDLPILVTTGDNVLLTPGAVLDVLAVLQGGADVSLAMASQASVMAAHPEGQRRFYRFSDDAYSNCNLYAFAGPAATSAAESFRSGGQFAKKPMRMIMALGPINLALMLMGRLSLRGALKRLGRRFRLKVEPVVLADGAHAIDVDNARTFAVAEELLARRAMADAA